ncbi:MAG: MFS transporter [Coriobacteriia bacterium]|nr:MFS transporter [Coriobacteriia bacterium]
MARGEGAGTWILAAVGVGTFMSALDASIVNVVLPVIRAESGAGVAAVQWVVTVYLLAVSGTLLGFGRLGDLYGHKRVYLGGFWAFVAGSVLCGIAPTVGLLAAARGVQGIGAAVLFANSPAIVTTNFPPQRRGRALGMIATATYLGLTVGPPVGGWLADALTWRAIFFINVPIGALALTVGWLYVPDDPPAPRAEPFDPAGAALFTGGLVALLLALNQAHSWGWASAAVLGLLAAAGALLAAFLGWQRRAAHPMLDLGLFASRAFSASTGAALLNYVAVYTVVFLMPFYLIQGRGMTASAAGVLLMVQPAVMAVAAPLAGALSDRAGCRPLTVAGMSTMTLGLLALGLLPPGASLAAIAGALAVIGLGTGAFISPNNSALMGSAPRGRQGVAAAVLGEARNVGMVLGVGFAGAIFTSILPGTPSATDYVRAASAALFAAAGVAAAAALVSSRLTGESSRCEAGPFTESEVARDGG